MPKFFWASVDRGEARGGGSSLFYPVLEPIAVAARLILVPVWLSQGIREISGWRRAWTVGKDTFPWVFSKARLLTRPPGKRTKAPRLLSRAFKLHLSWECCKDSGSLKLYTLLFMFNFFWNSFRSTGSWTAGTVRFCVLFSSFLQWLQLKYSTLSKPGNWYWCTIWVWWFYDILSCV